jgi:hypothetical protein
MSTDAIVPQPDALPLPSSEISASHVEQPAETSFIGGFIENKFVKRFIVGFLIDGSSLAHISRLVLALWQVFRNYIYRPY